MNRKNNFDFMRFVAATLVVYSHSFPLQGNYGKEIFARWSGSQFSGGELGVAIFFAMSGYLVTASQRNSANVLQFLSKRALRILPALAVVVLLTVFVLGPLLTTLSPSAYFRHPSTREYLWNSVLWVHFTLPGVFADVPYPDSVNGSLWTLPIEASMYLAVAALGFAGLLKRSWLPAGLVALVAMFAYIQSHGSLQQVNLWKIGQLKECIKFGIYFFAGATLYLFDRNIPWRAWIAIALLIGWIAAVGTPLGVYFMFAALPYCTLYIARASFAPIADFGRYGDFSYGIYIYAFPIQQTLVQLVGAAHISPLQLFFAALALSLACAFLSWHLVEKPALQLKRKLPAGAVGITRAAARD